jgi:hypothetical protein
MTDKYIIEVTQRGGKFLVEIKQEAGSTQRDGAWYDTLGVNLGVDRQQTIAELCAEVFG